MVFLYAYNTGYDRLSLHKPVRESVKIQPDVGNESLWSHKQEL